MPSRVSESDQQMLQSLMARHKERPNDVETLVRLGGLMFYPFHNTQVAIFYLESALRLDPKNVDARFWLANCLYHDMFDLDEARAVIDEALSLQPERPDCLVLSALIAIDQGRPSKDYVPILRRALELAPRWVRPRELMAEALVRDGALDEAERLLREALTLAETRPPMPDVLAKYVEFAITGRVSRDPEARLQEALDRIRAARRR